MKPHLVDLVSFSTHCHRKKEGPHQTPWATGMAARGHGRKEVCTTYGVARRGHGGDPLSDGLSGG